MSCDGTCKRESRWRLEHVCCVLALLKRCDTLGQQQALMRVVELQVSIEHAQKVRAAWKAGI